MAQNIGQNGHNEIVALIDKLNVGSGQSLRQVAVPEGAYTIARNFLKWAPNVTFGPDNTPLACRFKVLHCLPPSGESIYTLLMMDAGNTTLADACQKIEDWKEAAQSLLRYALNLKLAPKRPEFQRMKLSSSHYVYQVAKNLEGAEKILMCMGYESVSGSANESQELKYGGEVNTWRVIHTAADLVILHSELDRINDLVIGAAQSNFINVALQDILEARSDPNDTLSTTLQRSLVCSFMRIRNLRQAQFLQTPPIPPRGLAPQRQQSAQLALPAVQGPPLSLQHRQDNQNLLPNGRCSSAPDVQSGQSDHQWRQSPPSPLLQQSGPPVQQRNIPIIPPNSKDNYNVDKTIGKSQGIGIESVKYIPDASTSADIIEKESELEDQLHAENDDHLVNYSQSTQQPMPSALLPDGPRPQRQQSAELAPISALALTDKDQGGGNTLAYEELQTKYATLQQQKEELQQEYATLKKAHEEELVERKHDQARHQQELEQLHIQYQQEIQQIQDELQRDLQQVQDQRQQDLQQIRDQHHQDLEQIHNRHQRELQQIATQRQTVEDHLQKQIQELERQIETGNAEDKEVRFTQLLNPQGADSSWNVPRNEVKIREEIGRGASGLVSKGQFHGQTVAVKQIHQFILTQKHIMDEFKREVRIMASVQHPNLVRFIGAVFDESVRNFTATPLLIVELLHTSLRKAYENQQSSLSHNVMLSIFRDMAYGLHYLHEHQEPIIHRDVSAPNVLLEALPGGTWRAKLSDFGSANFLKRSKTLGPGAIVYTAPEMFPHDDPTAPMPRPTVKCDVFSYGIVLVEVITKTMPSEDNRHHLFREVDRKWQIMHGLIIQCVQRRPNDRPTMSTILSQLNRLPVARPR